MSKTKKRIIIAIIIVLLILAFAPFVFVLINALHNMTAGFVFDFNGTYIYGANAFVKTLILYLWVGWPVLLVQILAAVSSVILIVYLVVKSKK